MTAPPRPSRLPVGATVDRGFALLGRQARPIVLPALLLHVIALIAVVLLTLAGLLLLGEIETTSEQVRESTFFGDSTLETREVASLTDGQWTTFAILAALGGLIVTWFATAAYAAMILAARRADASAEPLPSGAALRESLRATPRLFGLTLIALVVLAVAGVIGWFVARGLYRAGGLPLMGLGGLAGLALVLVVGVRLLLVPVVALVEQLGVASFARTWRLTAGAFWPLLGLALLLMVVVTAVYVVVTLLLEALFGLLNALDTAFGSWLLLPYAALVLVLSVVYAAAFLAPLVVAHRSLAEERAGAGGEAGSPPLGGTDRAPAIADRRSA
ncbi:MAG: hypothetical protein ITG02_15975 [Patulibacter sp.]|nr:hypothetical protein [Patulibacter sp.]